MSPGHVFHPGHDEWHGQTVVVFTAGSRTVVGRWDAVVGDDVQMRDAALHQQGVDDDSREAWLERLKTYGVPAEHPVYSLPQAEVERVVRLRDV